VDAERVTNDMRMQMFPFAVLTASSYTHLQYGATSSHRSTPFDAIEYALAWSVVQGFQSIIH